MSQILRSAAELVQRWQGEPAAVLLRHYLSLPAEQQDEASSRDARALLSYITGGDFDRARELHEKQQAAIERAGEIVSFELAEKRRKTKERRERKQWLRDEVAALARQGATRREIMARLGATGWEVQHALNWNKRNGHDMAPPARTV